ncbi:MAG TPA: hypothetical protein VGI12_09835 [Vicinamibacterales bacterium]
MPKILRFADSPEFDGDRDIADILFWADFLDQMDDDVKDALVEDDDAIVKYSSWFIWDLDIDEGRTVADLFLEARGRSLDAAERAFVDRMRASHLSLYQVESLERGRGVLLRDLLVRETVFVHEKLGSEQLVRSDLVGARVVANEHACRCSKADSISTTLPTRRICSPTSAGISALTGGSGPSTIAALS